nr:unnamed protein product [Spirometra erinaceieuropaei]
MNYFSHGTTSRLLTEARRILSGASSEIGGLKVELEELRARLKDVNSSTKAQAGLWDEERAKLGAQLDESNVEVDRLQEQILKNKALLSTDSPLCLSSLQSIASSANSNLNLI